MIDYCEQQELLNGDLFTCILALVKHNWNGKTEKSERTGARERERQWKMEEDWER